MGTYSPILTDNGAAINFKGDSDFWGKQLYFFLEDPSEPSQVYENDFNEYEEDWPVVEGRVLRYPDEGPFPEIWVLEYQGQQFTLIRETEESQLIMTPEVTKFYT